jgi:DivIVA domain-containing protein
MGQLLIVLAGVLVLAALVWGVAVLIMGSDQGLDPAEPDGRAVPLPVVRPLTETDLGVIRFDISARGYRMGQVDQALRRAAYDIGYKEELITVLEAEVSALRDGRAEEAETLRAAREAAQRPRAGESPSTDPAQDTDPTEDIDPAQSVADPAEDTADPAEEATDPAEEATGDAADPAVPPTQAGAVRCDEPADARTAGGAWDVQPSDAEK